MRPGRAALLLVLAAPGCAYVTVDEYRALWDRDGDGWPLDEDCDDGDDRVYPYAPDARGDGCDADCGREVDGDGDDWPDAADCDPADPDRHPCSPEEIDGDGIDADCDGLDGRRADPCPGADPDHPEAEAIACD